MDKFRLVTTDGDPLLVDVIPINGIFKSSLFGATGWGRTKIGAVQNLIGMPPFETGISDILPDDGSLTRFQLLQKLAEQEFLENDWHPRVPTVWEISENAKTNSQGLSLWDYRISKDTPIARLIGTLTTASVRWRVVGAETYQMAARGGLWRASTLEGKPGRWPDATEGK